ncbi:helix-turn-helix domain-containing protein [Alteribacillus sp. HJP-4]|uniref:helix-turn-helix domain-containing protein n=1 Tax=Alteribacillus sp. HJP-4 TaxID=2775394 RepID=UPI0035CD3004
MSELGLFLKSKREDQGLTLERMQELTKIQKRYLQAIESGSYDQLPGAFYARAFVKSYAEALHLNPDEVFENYGSELPQPKQQTSDLPSRAERARPRHAGTQKKKKNSSIVPAAIGILFLVIVASSIWVVVQGMNNSTSDGISPENDPGVESDVNDEETSAEPEEEEPEQSENDSENGDNSNEGDEEEDTGEEGNEESEDSDSAPELVSSENRRAVFEVSGSDNMNIELEFSGESYVDAREDWNDNGSIIEEISSPGDGESVEIDYSDRDFVILNIGNSSAVTVSFNGNEIEYPDSAPHQKLRFDKDPEE